MSRFSIIIFPFFYAKISRKEEIFSKNSGKFSAAADRENKIEISQPPPRDGKNGKFPAAAAEKDIGLHLYFQYISVILFQKMHRVKSSTKTV
jgi:hypothetical protein